MKSRFNLKQRSTGLLLHPTSLPGRHGVGDLGPPARRFVDFLRSAGCSWWQMLPIGPPGPGNAPYSALSAFAGSPLLISLDRLQDDGLLSRTETKPTRGLRNDRVAYAAVARFKTARLRKAFARFASDGGLERPDYLDFCERQAEWLADHALFAALRRHYRGKAWNTWPIDIRLRRGSAVRRAAERLRDEIDFERFQQYEFERQWSGLRRHANRNGIGLIGDIPIFVAEDSSDVWAHRDLYDLDARGRARTVSGVPPDIFSKTGQRWGHPQYRWPRHRATGFAWWLARFAHAFDQFDAVRIDHFLGFYRLWLVPAWDKTTMHGRWLKTPGRELFRRLRHQLGPLNIIAEDLGVVTREAFRLRDDFGFPGMRLLHFAFGNDEGDRYNQPHNYPRNCVVFPGTHDNDTTIGWWRKLQREHRRRRRDEMTPYERALRYLGTSGRYINWEIIRLAMSTVANVAMFPVQDLLGLDNRARMNTPATTKGNWEWRLKPGQLTERLAARVYDLNHAYQRLPRHHHPPPSQGGAGGG